MIILRRGRIRAIGVAMEVMVRPVTNPPKKGKIN